MTSERVSLEPAWLLHSRSYRESSLLLELFSQNHGRIGLVAKGARRSKSGRQGLLQPFNPLLCSWVGRGELGTLTAVEPDGGPGAGLPRALIASGFYLNELLMRLLARNDPHPELFAAYANAIASMQAGGALQPSLRRFERDLMTTLGYALQLGIEAESGKAVAAGQLYHYHLERGPVPLEGSAASPFCIHGDTLLALEEGRFETARQQRQARDLMAAIIKHYLGGEDPRSRALLKVDWK